MEPPALPRAYGPAPRPPAAHAIVAPHSEAIRALAIPPDGSAAVSVDVGGSVRLWPSLDGTREPVVVRMRRPVTLAMMHNVARTMIAGIDGAGQLELVVTGPLGEPIARTPIALPRPAIAVHATTSGFLVERDDQHLVFLSPGGQIVGDVEPPAGTHIAGVSVDGAAMLALLAGSGSVHGRWLVVDASLHWGAETGALPVAPGAFALSPNHKAIAARDASSNRLVIVDLAHGDKTSDSPDGFDPTLVPIGFVDATTVAVQSTTFAALWPTAGDSLVSLDDDSRVAVAAVGGAQLVFAGRAELRIADAAGTVRYLGFRMPSLALLAAGRTSLLASDGTHIVRIRSDLREHATYDIPQRQDANVSVVAVLDEHHVLVQVVHSEVVYDVVELDTMDTTTLPLYERFAAYDARSRIAAFFTTDKVVFRRFDSATGAFGKKAAEAPFSDPGIVLEGTDAIVSVYGSDDATYAEVRLSNIRPDAGKVTIGRPVRHKLETGDPDRGPVAPVPTLPFTRSATSPDGALVATVAGGRMTLRSRTGEIRWTVAAAGATDVAWLKSGELLAIGGGLARVSLEDGQLVERRCGWQFGLWADRIDGFASAEMCEAE